MSKLNKFEDVDVFASLDAIMKQNPQQPRMFLDKESDAR